MAYQTVSCFPPLAQVTVVPEEQAQVTFTAFLEWDKSRPDFPFDVILSYSDASTKKHPSQWANVSMERSASLPMIIGSQEDSNSYYAAYTASVPTSRLASASERADSQHITFTVKYRVNSFAPWIWQQTHAGTPHGELLLKRSSSQPFDLSSVLKLEMGWKADQIPTDHNVRGLYSICTSDSIPRVNADNAKMEVKVLGSLPDQLRFMAIIRLEPYWIGPRHGQDYFFLGEDAILASFLTTNGTVVTVLAFNGGDDVYTVLQSGDEGQILVASRNDGASEAPFRVLVSVASEFEESVAAVMGEARKLVNQSPRIQELAKRTSHVDKHLSNDEWFDGLAYCTWNSLGQHLTTEKLLHALQQLTDSGIKVSTLLIDDNWQTLGETDCDFSDSFMRGWAEFEANKEISPDGMKGLMAHLRKEHPYLQEIGVWHALFGYWGGLAKAGKLAQSYKTIHVDALLMGNTPAKIYVTDSADIHQLYDDFYAFLSESGVNFVKTDVQHMPGTLFNTPDRRNLPTAYQSAWTCAHSRYFQSKAISCMSQIPENLYHSLLQTTTPRILLRNSDDFYPEIPASHPWHIWVNAHNSLLTQHLNVVPDWDMFQTSHSFSGYHAAARCVSGGPIFITDAPGDHDLALLEQIIAPSPTGRSITLRPRIAKATTSVWDNYTDGNVLRIGTSATGGSDENETGILGVFNVSEKPISFLISVAEFPGVTSKNVIVRSHRTGQLFGPVVRPKGAATGGPESLIQATLAVGGCDILTAYPVHNAMSSQMSFAVLGLMGKMTGSAALVDFQLSGSSSSSSSSGGGGMSLKIKLKAVEVLGLWIDGGVGITATMQGKEVNRELITMRESEKGAKAKVCEIDLLSFWKENQLFQENEAAVEVEVVIS